MSLVMENIKSFCNSILDNYSTLQSLFVASTSIITFVLSLPPFWKMMKKIFNWKDRKAIEYDIVYKKHKEPDTKFFKRGFGLLIEMYIPVWVSGLSLIAAYIVEYFISAKEVNNHAYLSIISLILLCMVAYVIHKLRIRKKTYIQLCRIMILILISLYGLLIISTFYNNSLGIIFVGGVVSLMFISVILVIDYFGFYQEYKFKDKCVRCVRLFRYIFIICCIMFFFYKISIMETDDLSFSNNVATVIILGWMIICCVEFFYLSRDSYKELIEYKIAIENEIIVTSCKISQYSGNKVKVKLNDGNVRIIDVEKIDFIEYEVEYNKRSKLKRIVTCFLKNEDDV